MFLFTFLLYHILSHLSRGFFIFFGGISSPKGDCFVVGIIQHFFSELALVHICIPQTYTPCGRIVGQRSYSLSWAPVLSVALPSPFVPLLYHTLRGLSRGIFAFAGLFLLGVPITHHGVPCGDFLLTALTLYHILSGLSRGFLHFLRTFFSGAPTPVLHSQWQAFVCGYPLPLTMIVYHTPPQKSTWQSAQIRASKLFYFCTTFLLTNCWRYGIMEIPAPTSEGAAPKD